MFQTIQISSDEKIIFRKVDYDHYSKLSKFLQEKDIDLTRLNNISNIKRKLEWMSIREMLVKGVDEKEDIIYNSQNKPHLKNTATHISISHSTDMVALGINYKNPIGIDLQHITDKIIRIKSKFLDDSEAQKCSNDPTELTCYWSVKEALFKLYGTNDAFLKENMKVDELTFNGREGTAKGRLNTSRLNTEYMFELRKFENYILAYSVNL